MDCETRKKILTAALKLFAAGGYDATPVSAIADEAGVGKSLVYHHFRKKDDMLDEIVDEFFREIRIIRGEFKEVLMSDDKLKDSLLDKIVRRKLLRAEPYLKILYSEIGKNRRIRERFASFLKQWTACMAEETNMSAKELKRRQFGFLIMFLTPLMSYYSMSGMYQDILGLDDNEIKEHFVGFIAHMRKMKGR